MSNFKNSSENREIDLLGYMPGFLSGFRELKAVFSAEDPEISALRNVVQASREAGFIASCPEKQLLRFEKMLGIYSSENEEISERRSRVLIRWNEAPPYTMAALNSKLAAICGAGNFKVTDDPGNYTLTIETIGLPGRQLKELTRILELICPANLIVNVENKKILESPQTHCLCGFTSYSTVISA